MKQPNRSPAHRFELAAPPGRFLFGGALTHAASLNVTVVKVLAPSERDATPDADGTLKWTLSLSPGEKRELPLKFSIEHPNDLPVVNME